jgi:(p)ppGpp synthase/HD superfamily hydrolase
MRTATNLKSIATELVKTRIIGHRKGLPDMPMYLHSIRVGEVLEAQGCSEDVTLGGILHDVVEDGEVTLDELKALGFSDRTIALVDLASHDINSHLHGDACWTLMIARLAKANDIDAWLIKIADISDNINDSHAMPPHRAIFLKFTKARLILNLTRDLLQQHPLWIKLAQLAEWE